MINLWFWTLIVAAPFGMAAFQQADSPSWKFPLVAVAVATFGFSYLIFGFPGEMFDTPEAYERSPDLLKFRAVVWVFAGACGCVLGALVGQLFRRRTNPVRVGVYAFLAAFLCLDLIVLTGETL